MQIRLKALSKRDIQFDVIFLDPPYNKGLIDKALKLISEFNLLKETGIIVCEYNLAIMKKIINRLM